MKAKKFFTVLLLLTGLLSVILSFSMDNYVGGSYETSITYGGDAYTGIQNAAAQTANNVLALSSTVSFGFQAILLIGGLSLIFYSCIALIGNKNEKNAPSASDITSNPSEPIE